MGTSKGNLQFTGTVGGITYYKRRDSDKIYVRTTGGADRDKIKTAACFKNTRKNNKEWSGCSKAGLAVRKAIYPVKHMAGYNISGPLNALAKTIQKLDTVNPWGTRAVHISKYKDLLAGFSLNTKNTFESVVRHPVKFSIDRNSGTATVIIPPLVPGINFQNSYRSPFFRFTAALGIVSDLEYNADFSEYRPINADAHGKSFYSSSEWFPAFSSTDELILNLKIKDGTALTDADTLILSAGIEFGQTVAGNLVEQIKYSGSAKIFAVG